MSFRHETTEKGFVNILSLQQSYFIFLFFHRKDFSMSEKKYELFLGASRRLLPEKRIITQGTSSDVPVLPEVDRQQ